MKFFVAAFWNQTDARLRAFWRIVFQIAATFILLILVMPLVMKLVANVAGPDSDLVTQVSGAVVSNTVLVATVILSCILLDRRRLGSLGLNLTRRWWLDLSGGFALGGVLMSAIFLIQLYKGWVTIEPSANDWTSQIPSYLLWIVAMVFVGIGEELFSRGYQLKNLAEGFKRLGVIPSVVLASLISSSFFSILHMFNPDASFFSSMMICLAGLLFCVARITTGSLAAPIGMHISWNYFQGGVFGFPVSGNRMGGSLIKIQQSGDPVWTGGEFGPEAGLLGVMAMVAAILVFLFWPRPETNWKQAMVELARFTRRTEIRRRTEMDQTG